MASSITKAKTYALQVPVDTNDSQTGVDGDIRVNNSGDANNFEFWNGSEWVGLAPVLDGSTQTLAADNATLIKNFTGTTTSDYYWIKINGTPRQVYCDMSGSQAYVLAMRLGSNTNTFGYDSGYWTNTSGLNNTSNPLQSTEIKNEHVWTGIPIDTLRITASTSASSYTANSRTFSGFGGNTLYQVFNQGTNIYDGNIALGRSGWHSWFQSSTGSASSTFDNQPYCNQDRINCDYSYAKARIGLTMNNENDCNSNDSAIGFGLYKNHGPQNQLSAGGVDHQAQSRHPCYGWMWVSN
jgi:hypothetical protein